MGNDGVYRADMPTLRIKYTDLNKGTFVYEEIKDEEDTVHINTFLEDLTRGRVDLDSLSRRDLRLIRTWRNHAN